MMLVSLDQKGVVDGSNGQLRQGGGRLFVPTRQLIDVQPYESTSHPTSQFPTLSTWSLR